MRAPILVGVLLIVVGPALVFLPAHDPLGQRVSNLGVEMLGGVVIALEVGLMQRRQERAAKQQHLQLMLGLEKDLTGTSLFGADLSGFYLRGKTLTQVDLSGANLNGARPDARTLWPKGFNPQAEGVIFVDERRPRDEHVDGNARP